MEHINEQLKTLRLSNMVQALEQQREQSSTYGELSFEERLSMLLEYEILHRNQNKVKLLRRQARLRLNAQISQISYKEGRGLNRKAMAELATGSYLHKHQNILITGATGAGKTFVGCALGEQACEQHRSVRYFRLSRLLDDLTASKLDGSYQICCTRSLKQIFNSLR